MATHFEQDIRDDVVYLADQLEQGVIRQMLERKLPLSSITRVSFPEDGVTITRNHLTAFERRPDIFLYGLIRSIFTNL